AGPQWTRITTAFRVITKSMAARYHLRVGAFLLATVAACGSDRSYPLSGQILAVDAGRKTVTIRHQAIPGFMAAMTMPFNVRDDRLLVGRTAGDLITATLVVTATESYVSSITVTGHSPVPETIPDEQRSGVA